MLDFTSVLYLGLEHAWRDLPGWDRLTPGKPAALEPPPEAAAVEKELALLTGCRRALLAPSTLHAFWDLFGMLARRGMNALVDEGSYPIARWGVERAAARGMAVRTFRTHDADHLERLACRTKRPVVVTDGFCPGCGLAAPLARYVACVKPLGGLVVIDDTQALGIFGVAEGPGAPYGRGGGGSLRRAGVEDGRMVVVSSMAKAFGAPVAMVGGSEEVIGAFETESATRVHCSPPSVAAIAAAGRALRVNRTAGDALRLRLARRVGRLREGLARLGLPAGRGLFPIQTPRVPRGLDAAELHRRLAERGVQTVLHRSREEGSGARLSFAVTARHRPEDIDGALERVADAIGCGRSGRRKEGDYYDGTEYRDRIVRPGW